MTRILLILSLVASLLVAVGVQTASATSATCNGHPVTIIATSANVVGTNGPDSILVRGDYLPGVTSVTVDAKGGDDDVCFWYVGGVVHLGEGNNYFLAHNLNRAKWLDFTIDAGSGRDTIFGGMLGPHSVVDCGGGYDIASRYATLGQSQPKFKNCEKVTINPYPF